MKIAIEVPDELNLKKDEIKIAALTKLYELGKYKVQISPDTEEELLRDIENAYC
ncbi:hypothetical protein [Persephonella sp. KM09-Lau-8]|uniref:hypothetical protein n=1 Tax=Persephonella sp. KM09-Lau-8 TaxID=1158345 RepID=UPI000B0537C8|nr:hypothetical protein [Persephonella sp. KM09-Lau-8]